MGSCITNTLSYDYGLRNNLTAGVSAPLINRYSNVAGYSGVSHTVGDLDLGTCRQPFAAERDEPSLTLTSFLRLATGTSPFKVDIHKGPATGAGVNTLNLGANLSKIVDPVALFGSFNLGLGLPAKHRSQEINGVILKQVKPGPSVGFGIGFAYALSYKVTTSRRDCQRWWCRGWGWRETRPARRLPSAPVIWRKTKLSSVRFGLVSVGRDRRHFFR